MQGFGLFWALFGALIGIAAAQRKGFSMVGGIIGGLLLGPLAIFMFLCWTIHKSSSPLALIFSIILLSVDAIITA